MTARVPPLGRAHLTAPPILAFVQCFDDPATLSATGAIFEDLEAQRRLAYELPWSHAVLRALELDEYRRLPKHDSSYLSHALGLGEDEIERSLDALEAARQIQWTGAHYALARVLTVDTRADPERDRHLKRHWSAVGAARVANGANLSDALFSYNLFAISKEHLARIRKLHLEYYDAVRSIVGESPRGDRVVLMNLQLIPLDGDGPSGGLA